MKFYKKNSKKKYKIKSNEKRENVLSRIKKKTNKVDKNEKKYKFKLINKIINVKFLENMSLKKQIIVAIFLILCIPIMIVTTYSYFGTKNTLTNKVKDLNSQTTFQMASNFQSYLEEFVTPTMKMVKDKKVSNFTVIDKEILDTMTEEEVEEYNTKRMSAEVAIREFKTLYNFGEAFIIYENGDYIGQIESSAFSKLAAANELYSNVKVTENSGFKWLTGFEGNYQSMFLARKLNDSSTLVVGQSVKLIDYTLKDGVNSEYQEVNIVNSNNSIIYSTNNENNGDNISDSWLENMDSKHGNFSESDSLITFREVDGFTLTNSVDESYIFKEVNDINKMIIFISVGCLIVALIIAVIIASKIVKPITQLVSLMKKVEEGNFTVESQYNSKNELGVLSTSFNVMTKNVKALIGNIVKVSDGIHVKVDNIKSISKNSTVAAQQVSQAIEEIAIGATDQAKQSEETLFTIQSLAKSINEVTGSIGIVSDSSSNTKEIGNGSLVKVKELEHKTLETNKTLNEITNTVITLVTSIKNIEGFLEVINSISNQTNLLAINASIEAAHAGEYGKGFSVVAGEVKKLADQSKESTEEIAKVIKNIQVQTSEVNKLIKDSSKIFEEQRVAVDYTSESFKDILLATEEITKEVGSVQELVSGMNEYKEISMNAIKNISTVAEESSASTEEVMASTEEQAYLSTELENLTENLYKEVTSLRNAVEKFKV